MRSTRILALLVAAVPALFVPHWLRRAYLPATSGPSADPRIVNAAISPRVWTEVSSDSPGFVDITDKVGLKFHHVTGPVGSYFMPEVVGTGGAFLDVDSDGDLDVFLVNADRSPHAVGEFPTGTIRGNRLFRQEPDGTFTDVSTESGLGGTPRFDCACAVGDVDNDGDLDIYVTSYELDRLFENDGHGRFDDITSAAGIHNPEWGVCAAFVDYDRDGWLDLLVVNYTHDPLFEHSIACGYQSERVSYCGPHKFSATVDRLYHNEGLHPDEDGIPRVRFRDVTEESGLGEVETRGLGLVCHDFDGDGWIDFLIANDASPNRLWINQRDGTFREEGLLRGVALSGAGRAEANMGIACGDADGDGLVDLVISHLTTETTTFYRGEPDGSFRDATEEAGIGNLTRIHTGWGVALADLDHDGHLDLPLVNGLVTAADVGLSPHGDEGFFFPRTTVDDPQAYWRAYFDQNQLLLNDGSGRFVDATSRGGDFCNAQASGRALVLGDVDNDGDLDLLVTNCGGRARLYRNELPKRGNWLNVRAVDPRWPRDAYGAQVRVDCGARRHVRTVGPSSSYCASHDVRLHFGLGPADRYDRIVVRWPTGQREEFAGGESDQFVVVRRGDGTRRPSEDEDEPAAPLSRLSLPGPATNLQTPRTRAVAGKAGRLPQASRP